ncbi:MAG: hypothetical protein PHY30_00720 [Candidatus Pacebacteria bacterium]|nr:hypothetical protein [Candidatus Paceibacterota bacterium]
MNKKILILAALFLLNIKQAFAVCPVCTIAVGAGVGLSRWLHIDDVITGLWIGGLIVSMIVWTLDYLRKKDINFKGKEIITIFLYYLLIILPLYFGGIMGHPLNIILGIDKLLFGIILGSLSFCLGVIYYDYLKERNNGHAYFPFQKVVMPVLPLIILSIVFYFLTK